jgi:hypothetical protein
MISISQKEGFFDMDKSVSMKSIVDIGNITDRSIVSRFGEEEQIGFIICLSESEAIAITLKCKFLYYNSTTQKQI